MFEFTEEYEPLLRDVRETAEKVVKPVPKKLKKVTNSPSTWPIDFFRKGIFRF